MRPDRMKCMKDGCRGTAEYVDTRLMKHRYKCDGCGGTTERDTACARGVTYGKYAAMALGACTGVGGAVMAGASNPQATVEIGNLAFKISKKGIKWALRNATSDPQVTVD